VPPRMQGHSFRALLEGRPYEPRHSAYMEIKVPFGYAYKAIRTAEDLYIMEHLPEGYRERLFDMRADPHQLHDIAGEAGSAQRLAGLRHALLTRWFEVESQYPLRTASY